MYKDFFGLVKLPFNLTPDPEFLFLPPGHREALAGLTYGILERKGFVVLTGDAGTGKTTLINSVLSRLPADRVESSVILNPTLTAPEFLEGVLLDFEVTDLPASKAQRLWRLQELLARTHRDRRFAVLVIDEAHKLSIEVLEEIRLLGNYESGSEKFLQILLLGQSELDGLMDRRDLRQLKQRVALRLYINPLTHSEIEQYIGFRWAKAGGMQAPPFSAEAMAGVIQWSHGIPRQINSICDSALLMAYGEGSHWVGVNFVREAASSLGLIETVAVTPPPNGFADKSARLPVEKPHSSLGSDPTAVAGPSKVFSDMLKADSFVPQLAPYGGTRNSSLLKRLSEKLGLS
jgi:general secretion pathway protein A